MKSYMRALGIEYNQQAQDAVEVVKAAEAERHPTRSHGFELLDTVFRDFLATNMHRGKHFSFQELLGVRKDLHLRYTHLSVYSYLGTVFLHEGPDRDADWVNIKLCHYGFTFSDEEGYMSRGWVQLPLHKYHPYLTSIKSTVGAMYDRVKVYCNYDQQCCDMMFWPKEDAAEGTPCLQITFQPGYPDMEDELPPDERLILQ